MNNAETIFLSLTTRCYLKCLKCWRSQVWGRGQDIDRDVLDRFMLLNANYHGRIIVGSGENLVCRHLEDYIDWVVDKPDIKTTILTTALTFDKVLAKRNYFHPKIQWGITMDGFRQEQVADIQKGMNIERVKRNLRNVKQKYPNANLYINFTHTKANLSDTMAFIHYAHEIGIRELYLTQLKLFEGLDDSVTKDYVNDISSSEFQDTLNKAKSLANQLGIYLYAPLAPKKRLCFQSSKVRHAPIIDVNGDISFCYGRDDTVIGNIMQNDDVHIWEKKLNSLSGDLGLQQEWCSQCHASKINDQGYYFIPREKHYDASLNI